MKYNYSIALDIGKLLQSLIYSFRPTVQMIKTAEHPYIMYTVSISYSNTA
jgi:hypothetical protein